MKTQLQLRFPVSALSVLKLNLAAQPLVIGSTIHKHLVTVLLALALWLAPLAQATPNTTVAPGIGNAPAALVAAIARTQAQDAAQNPAYTIGKNGCAQLGARNIAAVLTGCFSRTGPAFNTGKQTLRLRLSAWGRAGHLRPVTLTHTAPQANRIEYRGQHLAEWWRVLPLGYEQSFTIAQTPAGSGKVVLELSASRAPKIVRGQLAWGKLRYGKLHVTDANGKVLPATLSAKGRTITLAFNAAHARYPVSVDPLVWVQQQEVTATDGATSDNFGTSVALSANGTTALVGADTKTVGGNSGQGAAYVYTLAGGTWNQAAELTAANGAAYDDFGTSVTLSANGTTALVGADGYNNHQGAAYVYTKPSGGWATTSAYTAELTATNGAANNIFGWSVALSTNGATALVGAPYKTVGGNSQQGAAYVYTLAAGTWSQAVELIAANGATGESFGWSVALSANGATALMGTPFSNSGKGAAYVYTLAAGTWSQAAELTAANGAASDEFGNSVALSANGITALVGAYYKIVGGNYKQGAAYVYTKPGGGWASTSSYSAFLTAANGATNDAFGTSVTLSGDGATALVGADGKNIGSNGGGQGAAYVYTLAGGAWSQAAELIAANGAGGDRFGSSAALSTTGTTTLVGAYLKTVGGNVAQGAAYFFGSSDLSAVLSAPATVQTGTPFLSQYILTNAGTTASGPVTVTLPVPTTNAGFVSFGASQGSCNYDATTQVATCNLGSIVGNGGTASASLTLKATGTASSTIAQSGQLANGSSDLVQTANTTIVPPPPTASGLGNVSVAYGQSGTETFTLTGTGTLTVTTSSSNTTLLPTANIMGASACTQAGSCTLTLTPVSGQSGSATVTVSITDAYSQSGTGAFTFTVQPPPTAPVANNLSLTTYENSAISTNLSADAPNGDTLSYAIAAQPTHGAVTVNAGTFTYTPSSGYSGSDSFTFTATDTVTGLISNTATVAITINPTPPPGQVPPVASNLTLSTYTGQALVGTLPAVVTPNSDTLSYVVASQPAHGTVTVSATTGAFTYTPTSGYNGSDSFAFTAKDTVTGLVSNTATVAITVKATPSSPAPSSGGGGFGPLALFGLLFLALVPWWLRHRGLRSTPIQPTENTLKSRLKLRFLVSTLAALMLSLAALPALAAPGPGAVDPAFNNGRPAILDMNSSVTSIDPYAAAMNPLNGDILWAGYYRDSTTLGGAIAAYKPDGSLDPAISSGPTPGTITLTAAQAGFTGGNLKLYAIAVDGQGRILTTGYVGDTGVTTEAMVLARFKPDGSLDTGFGGTGTGIVTAALHTGAFGTGLSLTADGHIIVTGEAVDAGLTHLELTVWRFNPNGTADTAFGSTGHVQIAAINDYAWWCLPALQPDGALIAGCSTTTSWKLTRLKADGTVDTSFGTSGYLTGGTNQQLTGLALAPDGGFVIGVVDTTTSPYLLDMRRFLAAGTVDPDFNGGNPRDISFVPSGVSHVPIAVQPDGKILISYGNGGSGLFILRLLANGADDLNFGNSVTYGGSLIDFSNIGGFDYTPTAATALLLQGDGSIVASGWADSTAGIGEAAFVTRVLSDAYDLTPTAPAFTAVARAPLGQALASNAVTVSGVSIGSATSGFSLALTTVNGKYSTSGGAPFAGGFTATNGAWAPAGSSLALEQMTPPTGGTDTTTSVILGGFWAANNYEVPLGSPPTASWTTTTDQPPVASNGTLSATTAKATTGTLSATNPSSGTLAFAIVTAPAHGTATITNTATGAYSYTSAAGYTGSDSFTWKVNDGVADSNIATEGVTVKAAPSSGGGGGGFGLFALLGLLALALLGGSAMFRKRRAS